MPTTIDTPLSHTQTKFLDKYGLLIQRIFWISRPYLSRKGWVRYYAFGTTVARLGYAAVSKIKHAMMREAVIRVEFTTNGGCRPHILGTKGINFIVFALR